MNIARRLTPHLRKSVDKLIPVFTARALRRILISSQREVMARDQMLIRRLERLERGNSLTRRRVVELTTEFRRRARAARRESRADAAQAAAHRAEVTATFSVLTSQLQEVKAVFDDQAKQLDAIARRAQHDNIEVTNALSILTSISADLSALEAGEHGGSLRKRMVSDVAALLALREAESRPLLPVPSTWSMTPQVLEYVSRTIRTRDDVMTVVELGSGTSTPWLASAIAGRPHARLVCFEHDEHYASLTRQQLEVIGLGGVVELRCQPLAPVDLDGETFLWYQGYEDLADIDLLIVDGPPGETGPRARYPALPLLLDGMSDGGVVVLDDANRVDEMSIIDLWSGRTGERVVTLFDSVDRAAVLHVGRVPATERPRDEEPTE